MRQIFCEWGGVRNWTGTDAAPLRSAHLVGKFPRVARPAIEHQVLHVFGESEIALEYSRANFCR
jgi:hypothetical protein